MSDLLSRELPAPKNWQDFERLTFDLYRRLWKTSDAELNGRAGQPQAGVDVYGTDHDSGRFVGVQCKGKDGDLPGGLTEAQLRDEVAKALTFQPPIEEFILVTTAPNDTAIQTAARRLSAEHSKVGRFSIQVKGWTTLRQLITDFPDLVTKHFGDFAPIDLVEAQRTAHAETSQGLAEILSLIQRSSDRIIDQGREAKDAGDPLAARVTEIGRLVSDGSPKTAIRALERLLVEEGAGASPLARFRLYANLANAHFTLGDNSEGYRLGRAANEAYPEYPDARAFMATILEGEGRKEEAFAMAQAALAEDPESVRAAGVVVGCAPCNKTADLELLLPDAMLRKGDILLRLSIRANEIDDAACALDYARRAVVADPDDWRMQAALGEALVQPLSKREGISLTNALPHALRDAVAEATLLFEKAWAILASRESSYIGRHVAANLIGMLSLVGRDEEADRVAGEAIDQNPGYEPLILRFAQRDASAGDWAAALSALKGIPKADLRFESALLIVQAALQTGKGEEAVAAAADLLAIAPAGPQAEVAAAFAALAAIADGADRIATIDNLLADYKTSVIIRSIAFDACNEDDVRRPRLAAEIATLAAQDLSPAATVHAAETLFLAGSYGVAADLYARLHDGSESYVLRKHLRALFLADRRKEARALFEQLPKDLRIKPDYAGLGVAIYERAGLLKPAIALMEAKLGAEETLHDRLGWLQLLARIGRTRDMIAWLKAVPEDVEGTPSELLRLAQIIERYTADTKAYAIGYRALRGGYGDEHIHLNYAIGLVLAGRNANAPITPPEVVAPGVGVILEPEGDGDPLYRMIETEPNPVIERGEIDPDGEFAGWILGLRKGDRFEIPRLGEDAAQYVVREIQERTHFAFQRTLRDFTDLFPGNKAFGSFTIDESRGKDRFEPVFAAVRRRAEFGKQVENLYEQGLPFFTLAKFSGASVFDLWEGFRIRPGTKLRVALGEAREFEIAQRAATGAIVVLDPLSIYAWSSLGFIETMARLQPKFAVVQSSLDLLRAELEERRGQRGKRLGTIVWDGAHYHSIELDEEAIEQNILVVERAVRFAEACQLVPAESDVELPDQLREVLEDAHDAYGDSLMAALQSRRTLLTDDFSFRVVAQEAGARVCWTQTMVQANLRNVPPAEYRGLIGTLLQSTYQFVQFSHVEIIGEYLESGWQTNDAVLRFAANLADEVVTRASAAQVVARLILDAVPHAPNDAALAAFPLAYRDALVAAGREATLGEEFDRIFAAVEWNAMKRLNRMHLPRRLIETTHLVRCETIVAAWEGVAERLTDRLRKRLERAGLLVH